MENQLDIFQKKQKINIIKNNQLIEEIHEIEKKNNNKSKEIDKLKKELENLKKINNNITDNSDDYDKDNLDKITSKKIAHFERIEIDANKNKEDNS